METVIIKPVVKKEPVKELGDNVFVIDSGIDIIKEDKEYYLLIKAENKIYKILLPEEGILDLFIKLRNIEAPKSLITKDDIDKILEGKIVEIILWANSDNKESSVTFVVEKDSKKVKIDILYPLAVIIED